jgi:hypothetical protein
MLDVLLSIVILSSPMGTLSNSSPTDDCVRSNYSTQAIEYVDLWYALDRGQSMTVYYIYNRTIKQVTVLDPSRATHYVHISRYGGNESLVLNNEVTVLSNRVIGATIGNQRYFFTEECNWLID